MSWGPSLAWTQKPHQRRPLGPPRKGIGETRPSGCARKRSSRRSFPLDTADFVRDVLLLSINSVALTRKRHHKEGFPRITNHKSRITSHESPVTNHQSPVTSHQSPQQTPHAAPSPHPAIP